MTRTQFTGRLLASVLALACAGAVCAEQASSVDAPATAGMRVFKDPVTGKFREPTADDVKALERAGQKAALANRNVLNKSGSAGANKVLPNKPLRTMMSSSGAVGMEVPESEYNYLAVTRSADGKLHQVCAQGEDAAVHASHTPVIAQETVYETQ